MTTAPQPFLRKTLIEPGKMPPVEPNRTPQVRDALRQGRIRYAGNDRAGLHLVLQGLQRPDDPEAQHGDSAPSHELASGVLQGFVACPPSHGVDATEYKGHHAHGAWELHDETLIGLAHVPDLARLALHLGVLDGALDDGTCGGTADSCEDCGPSQATRERNFLLVHALLQGLRVDGLKHCELRGAVNGAATQWGHNAPEKASDALRSPDPLDDAHHAAVLSL
eukprot:CAMPEP_0180505320 /NCGR_PEP_ID=MMETSP1036_2-20121128/47295_1 /TAXON_ID=632150 /ORGANISM="Azadinium spinosum, Strain 3D9" /LENGTH=222 /DNA_ID=CAMNT_0022514991 /DNA_START=26 /DNA_END=693 /DNA_ORIENTATION=-